MDKAYNELPFLPPDIEEVLWDREVIQKVLTTNKEIARLNWIEQMNDRKISEIFLNSLVLTESIWSNDIENINTNIDKVSISKTIKDAQGNEKETLKYRDALLLGLELLEKNQWIISINNIVEIQQTIEENQWGIRKVPWTKLTNAKTDKTIYFPPDPHFLWEKLDNLEKYINDDTLHIADGCIKSAIIHHQFESIHPFYDGNWRTGRIIILLYLIKQKLINYPVLFISGYLNENKWDYYKYLQEVRVNNNRKGYILYMLDAIEKQSRITSEKILEINKLYRTKRETIFDELKMDKKEVLIDLLFQNIYISFWELLENLDVSKPTLIKKLWELEEKGIVQKTKQWKNSIYYFEEYVRILKK